MSDKRRPPAHRPTTQPPRRQTPEPPRPWRRGKLAGSLIGLSSAAIVSIYTLGYVNTRAADDQLTAMVQPTAVSTSTPTAQATSRTSTTTAAASPTATATPVPSQTTSSQTSQSGYQDGTYSGSGNSRHGGMTVEVVIAGGQITSVAVTSCHTRYSCDYVDPLINLVVQDQAVPAQYVSGATDSSNAFRQAVSSALSQAASAA